MKKIIALFVFVVTSSVYAQNSGITYQAVIYNPSSEILPGNNNPNVVLAEKNICLRFSISDANSSIEYQEVQKVKTDEFGMVNLIVGDGDQVSGYAANFDAIIWNSSNKNLKVEIDTNGNCTNFIEISNQKFASVPFAFASKVAETVSGIVPIVNGGTGAATVAGAKTNLGLNNVDNTSDLNKPVSTATQTALDAKAPLASPGFTGIPTAPTAAAGTSTTQIATTAFVNAALATAASPDATATQKGRIQLAGDLGGTADAPTVPGLANKENAANKSTDTSLGNSDILFPTQKAVKTYVDNLVSSGVADATTSDKGKIQLAGDLSGTADAPTVPGLLSKEPTITAGTNSQYYRGDKTWQTLDKTAVGLDNVDNTSDSNKPVSTATQTALNAKENTITPGTTAQYWRGDKTWQTLEKTAVGLGNVNNTADLDKPVSTATQTALNAKENAANKSDVTTLGLSDVLFPTQKAVKTYVDTEINAKATPDATASDKGKIQLAGDLAGTGSSAASPVISNNAITPNKIATAAVTPIKIQAGSSNTVLVTDALGAVVWRDKSAFGAVADLTTIEGLGTPSDPLKVKDLGITTAKINNEAVTTVKLADDAVTNAKIGETISVENGGTGATSLTGYLKGNGTAALSSVSTIPVTDVTGAVRSVNGVLPDNTTGNVAVVIGRVFTGTAFNPNSAASVIAINSGPNPIKESDIYIVSGQSGTPNDNGRTFINDGTNWLEISTNVAALESTFVKLSGSTMAGNLDFPTGKKIIIADAPTGSTDAANKAYVDNLITSSATPDATTSIIGKIKLAGDLGGTAAVPTVPGLALKAPLESPSLTGTPLAPTAAAGTNTTQIATTEFVTAATAGKQNAITLTTTGTGAASLTGSTLNIPTPNNGTVTEVSALTIGTSGTDITSTIATATTTPVVTLNVPTASAANRGALSAADWTTFNDKIGGSGTTNYVPKFSAAKTLTDSSIFDDGTKVGIGTASPANTLEIKQGTAGNSGLRFTNLTASSSATTSSSKVLGLNSNGDVILTNVPGTQNIVDFSTATPTTSGVVFTPNSPADESVVYQSAINNSLWTYNGTTYVTYTAPASTAWYTSGTTNDAGNSKTSNIYRTGSVGIGVSSPAFPLDVQSPGVATYVPIARFLAPSNTGIGNSSMLNFGVNNAAANSADWRYVYQTSGATNNRVDFGMSNIAAPMISYLNSGNVGIGTTAPATKLHIQGSTAEASINVNANILRFSRPGVSGSKWDNIAQFNLGNYTTAVNANTRLDLALNDGATLVPSNVMTWQANGNVGINTTSPSAPLVVQANAVGTGVLKLAAPSVGADNWWMGFSHGINNSPDSNDRARIGVDIATGGSGRLFFTTGAPGSQTRAMFIDQNQRVGIGTSNPTSTLELNGSATNTVAFNSGSATAILFNNSNLAYTSASPTAFSLQGMKDGGTYTLAVQGTTSGLASFIGLNPSGTSFTFLSVNNGATLAGKQTLYTFIVMGTTVYYYMATGFGL